uniref:Uncharacterized protein n=1 Tax=Myoviridae sp. ctMne5 TaxID=2825089 RepID=A0A8S5TZZ0_9CAUD|nr:MAG TPA: hypothetical protein [Myoviridae sp. ctMne5]
MYSKSQEFFNSHKNHLSFLTGGYFITFSISSIDRVLKKSRVF